MSELSPVAIGYYVGPSVYFVQEAESGFIKIGFSSTPRLRAQEMQVGNPRALTVVGVIHESSRAAERDLHKRFSAYRIRREWFKPAPELLDFIRGLNVRAD